MNRLRFLLCLFFFALGGFAAVINSDRAPAPSSAHQAPSPEPSPAPLNQNWRVEYGEIELLEEKLRTLNAAGRQVTTDEVHVSHDGKRFVILTSDFGDEEEGR